MEAEPEADAGALRSAATYTRELTGEASKHREAIEHACTRLAVAWTGSLRHEPATATAYAAEAARKVTEGIARLHCAATCLEEAVTGLTQPW